MFRNMVTSLFKHDRIKTTDAKAKELRRWADHIVTLAKRGDLHARRMAMSIMREKNVVHKIFEEAPERFGSINGGYTRIVKIGRRAGDAAAMTIVELISSDDVRPAKKKKAPKKPDTRPADQIETAAADTEASAESPPPAADTQPVAAAEIEASPVATDDAEPAADDSEEKDLKSSPDPTSSEK